MRSSPLVISSKQTCRCRVHEIGDEAKLNVADKKKSSNNILSHFYFFQHANEDVERMLLGNKCDMEDKRVVPKAKGEQVRWCSPL